MPGVTWNGGDQEPVLLLTTRGMKELITGWDSYAQMRGWLASRGTTGSADLEWPGPAAGTRAAAEERVLIRLVTDPQDTPLVARGLGPSAFTSDVRYDLYLAALSAAADPELYTPAAVSEGLVRRVAGLPSSALGAYGGPGAPSAWQYLRRLAATYVTRDEALSAADMIRAEDSVPETRNRPPRPVLGHSARQDTGPTARKSVQVQPRAWELPAGPGMTQ
jgi:hypothetical protein